MDIHIGGFRLERPIGRGGMSEVWLARHVAANLPVAIKILRITTSVIRDAFSGEVRAMARIDHPSVVAILDHGEIDAQAAEASGGRFVAGSPWIAMEYCSEGTLEGFIPASWNGLRRILFDLLAGLGAAHVRGVLHLDLKPDNILVAGSKDLRPGRKLSDFGLSEAAEGEGWVLGTPAYMAPEQFEGRRRDYGSWTDLYAMGCLGWALSTGQPPFGSDRPPEVLMMAHGELPPPRLKARIAVPDGLEGWLRRLLEKRPEHRFRSAGEAMAALHLVDGQQVPRFPKDWGPEIRTNAQLNGLSMYGLRELPVVGYVEQRRALWSALLQVEEHKKPQVVVLHGPTGRGRSRLARWLVERVGELGLGEVLRMERDEGMGALRRWVGDYQGESELLARLESWYPGLDAYDRELVGAAVGGQGGDRGASQGGDRVAGVRRFLLGLGRLVVLWIEDAWEDAEVLDFIARISGPDAQKPLLVVMTVGAEQYRGSVYGARLAEVARGERCRWVDVGGLGPVEIEQLLVQQLRVSPDTANEIRHRSQGNPAFVIQVVNDQVQRGILVPTPGGLVLKPGATLVLPQDLRTVWSERLDRQLSGAGIDREYGRRVLEVAGFCSDPVEEREWLALCTMLGFSIDGLLVNFRKAGIFSSVSDVGEADTPALVWGSAMVRECVVQDAREGGRDVGIRKALVGYLQQQVAAHKLGVSERLAENLLISGNTGEALAALIHAARELQQLGDRGGALRLVVRAQGLTGGMGQKERRRGELLLLQCDLLHAEGEYEGARQAAAALVEVARGEGWRDLLLAGLVELADVSRVRGQPSLALGLFQEARELARASGDRRGMGSALAGLGELAGQFGELGQAMQLLQQALRAFEEVGDRRRQADALRELADMARRAGQLDVAEGWVVQSLELYRSPTVPSGIAAATNIQGAIARQRGRLMLAEALATRSLRMFEALESRQVVFPLCNLGLILTQTERAQDGRGLLEKALGLVARQGRRNIEGWGHTLILPALARMNDLVAWDHHFALAAKGIEESDLIDPDIAEALVLGARWVREPRRASAAWELARSQWVALGFQARVAEANAELVKLG